MKRVFVISPHPDDESIGCGGAIRKHVEQGDSVRVIFLTSGEKGGHGRDERETTQIREQEAKSAARILGIEAMDFYRWPDGAVETTPAAVARLREALVAWSPDWIYVPHFAEAHADHRAAIQVLEHALQELPSYSPQVWMYEIWTPLQRIDAVEDISPYMEVKMAAIRAHRSQCEVMAFDEAARGLSRYRGEMHSWPGGDYAEVFAEWRPPENNGRK